MQLIIDKTPSIFEQGFLTNLFLDKLKGKTIIKLQNQQLTRIATILGRLSKDQDLYDLLFTQPQQMLEVDNVKVNTKDLAAFVMLDHTYTRGYFAKQAGGKAQSDTTNSQGVPLALEGAKRIYNKSYMDWLEGLTFDDLDELWEVDVFLPSNLASLELNDEGNPVQRKKYGLLVLMHNNVVFAPEVVNQLRQEVPNWKTTPTPKMVKEDTIDEEMGKIYNKCDHKLRCMILQGWVWDTVCRNDAMICDIHNWDEYPASIGFEGCIPKDNDDIPEGIGRFLGL